MKKLFYSLTTLFFPLLAAAQLQNLDFENWDNPIDRTALYANKPTGWVCSNRWLGGAFEEFSPTFYAPVDTNAQLHQYALRLSVWYNYTKDAALQAASIRSRPSALKAFYKYENNLIEAGTESVVDTAQVVVMLSKWNQALSKRDTVGFGLLKIYEATSQFKELKVEIIYSSAAIPDSLVVFFDPSIIGRVSQWGHQHLNSGTCSFFSVDNISLVSGTSTGINDITPNINLNVHPNPTTDLLQFETISGTVSIFDITGQRVLNQTLNQTQSLDVSHLTKGIYFMGIKNEEGNHTSKFVKR